MTTDNAADERCLWSQIVCCVEGLVVVVLGLRRIDRTAGSGLAATKQSTGKPNEPRMRQATGCLSECGTYLNFLSSSDRFSRLLLR